jgi:hypothetical protein
MFIGQENVTMCLQSGALMLCGCQQHLRCAAPVCNSSGSVRALNSTVCRHTLPTHSCYHVPETDVCLFATVLAVGLTSAMYIKDGQQVPCPDPRAGLYICDRSGQVVQAAIPARHIAYQVRLRCDWRLCCIRFCVLVSAWGI